MGPSRIGSASRDVSASTTPCRVRSLSSHACFRAAPKAEAALHPAATPLSRTSSGCALEYSRASREGSGSFEPMGSVEAAT